MSRIVGATWGDGDVILFSTGGDLWRVSASGGSPERILQHGQDEYSLKLPQLLPGGKSVLFTRQRSAFRWDDAQILARSLVTGEQKVLLDDAADARYVPSGHIVFVRRGKLMAAPFDPGRLTLLGGTVAFADDVMQAANMTNTNTDSGAGQFAISAGGTLAYVTGGMRPDDDRELVWVSRDGTAIPIPAPKQEYVAARLSRDGQKVVAFTGSSVREGGERVWVYDVGRNTLTPLTTQKERAAWGMFSPDGARIVYQLELAGRSVLAWKAADGTGTAEQLDPSGQRVQTPSSWSNDGKIAFVQNAEGTGADIWVLDAQTRKATPVIQTASVETHPTLSPDGKWLAYVSNGAMPRHGLRTVENCSSSPLRTLVYA